MKLINFSFDQIQKKIAFGFFGFIFVFVGMIIGQGSHLDFSTYFTPWQHDDYWVLEGLSSFTLVVRPVFTNLAKFVGGYGEITSYVFYTILWFSVLLVAQSFVLRALDLKVGPLVFLIFAGAGSAIWFLQPQSTMSLQFVALIVNALSCFFAISAALFILHCGRQEFLDKTYKGCFAIAVVLVFLAAFTKEDMVLFLIVCSVYSAYLYYASRASKREALKHLMICSGMIVVIYGLSLMLSFYLKSPFLFGKGPYDVSSFPSNLVKNMVFYVTGSQGFGLMVAFFLAAIVIAAVLVRKKNMGRSVLVGLIVLVCCSGAMMSPYLVLPRQFDYYAMNFVPLIAFSIVPVLFVGVGMLFEKRISVRAHSAIALILAIGTVFLFSRLDRNPRDNVQKWMAYIRNRSAIQFNEVERAVDLGLKNCQGIRVTGVSNELGPFQHTSEKYINKRIGSSLSWSIVANPGTKQDNFKKRFSIRTDKWQYVSEGEEAGQAGCTLEFNPKTLRANLLFNAPVK